MQKDETNIKKSIAEFNPVSFPAQLKNTGSGANPYVTFSVPPGMEDHLRPFVGASGRPYIVYAVPVSSVEQAEAVLRIDMEFPTLPAAKSAADDDSLTIMDSLCPPCDVQTMARRLNLDPRRVQQLAKESPGVKNDRGEYVCPRFVVFYSGKLQVPKRSRASGLVKKQEESLEIRNARDRAEVLADWEVMVQRQAVVEELAPLFLSVRNGMRQMSNALSREIMLFVKEEAEKISNGEDVRDYEIVIRAQKMLSSRINDNLSTFSKGIAAWAEASEAKDKDAGKVARSTGRFWEWVRKKFV